MRSERAFIFKKPIKRKFLKIIVTHPTYHHTHIKRIKDAYIAFKLVFDRLNDHDIGRLLCAYPADWKKIISLIVCNNWLLELWPAAIL